MLGNWNQSLPPADYRAGPSGDNFVGIADLGYVLGNWNAGVPPVTSGFGAGACVTGRAGARREALLVCDRGFPADRLRGATCADRFIFTGWAPTYAD
ncbi:MAG: hypothetical protein R3C45_18145 [Phycisphaerales bacterium]